MRLIASSASIEGLEKLLREYFLSSNISVDRDTYEITNSKGPINGFKIINVKNRFKAYGSY